MGVVTRSKDDKMALIVRSVGDGHALLFCTVQKMTYDSDIFSLKKNTYVYMGVPECMYMHHMFGGPQKSEEALDPLELELQIL